MQRWKEEKKPKHKLDKGDLLSRTNDHKHILGAATCFKLKKIKQKLINK